VSDNASAPALPDISPIRRLIRRARRLLRSSWVVTGLGLTVGLLFGTLVAVTLVDLMAPLGVAFRVAALAAVGLPAAWVLLTRALVPLFRRLSAAAMARRIEAHIPGMHNRLVSSLDLSGSAARPAVSQAFYRRLLSEALERIRGFRARRVVDFLRLRRAALYALSSTAAFLLAFYLFSDRLPTAVARILNPFADIPPVSGVAYTVSPGDSRVLRGEDIVFKAHVTKGEPDRLYLLLKSPAADKPLRHDLEKLPGNVWKFTLAGKLPAGFEDQFTYRVYGGGTWSKRHRITLVERPTVVSLYTVLHYPRYMGLPPEKRVSAAETAEVAGPEGGEVEVVVQAEGDVRRGEVQTLKAVTERRAVRHRPERVWFEKKLPAGARPDVVWKWDAEPFHGRRHTHTEDAPPFGSRLAGHGFQGAARGFVVQPGESLFAFVFVPPGRPPKTIMLEWHDGTGWEHRAFWGANPDAKRQADTPDWFRAGPLPEPGRWVRLEVPAAALGLEGGALDGMNFKAAGAQVLWQAAGTVPGGEKEHRVLVPDRRFAMRPLGKNAWASRFPLTGEGLYRVELRNALDYPNKTMKESRFTALPDNPPQIVLDHPESDLTLGAPAKVRLAMKAFDDYGLKEVAVEYRREGRHDWTRRVVKRYAQPVRDDGDFATTLDLKAMGLALGDALRYRVEAVDRKSQRSASSEFAIRLAAGPSTAEQQLAAFEKTQDPFQQRLAELIAAQTKVHETAKQTAVKYKTLTEKVKALKDDTKARPDSAGKPQVLDPKDYQELAALQKALAELAQRQQANLQQGEQLNRDLARSAEEAGKLQMLKGEIARQMQAAQQTFERQAVRAMKDLLARMNRAATAPKETPPDRGDLEQMLRRQERLGNELEAFRKRMEALAEARKKLLSDPSALEELRKQMLRQDSGLSARDLAELREHLTRLQAELNNQKGRQERLKDQTGRVPDKDLPDLEKKQGRLDLDLAKLFNKAGKLLANKKIKRLSRKRKLDRPRSPYAPETEDEKAAPKEEDSDEPLPTKKGAKDKPAKSGKAKNKNQKEEDDEDGDERKYLPQLGGKRPRTDPRYAKKLPRREKSRKNDGSPDDPDERREQLEGHQLDNLRDLDAAAKSLESDADTLRNMLRQLQRALQGKGDREGEPDSDEALRELAAMMQSSAMRRALAIAARMSGMQSSNQGPRQPMPNPGNPNLTGAGRLGPVDRVDLNKLDLPTRTMILRLRPKEREKLLQGLRNPGPEGYEKHIQEYYKRLLKMKGSK
jgi:hypothetical protein